MQNSICLKNLGRSKLTNREYEKGYYKVERVFEKERQRVFQYHLNELLLIKSNVCNILDIGCSLGCFLSLCDKRGIDTYGLEISDYAIQEARKNTKAVIKKAIDVQSLFVDKEFDIITAFDLVEHLNNDKEIFKFIYNRLSSGGVFYGTTPNKDYLFSRFLGEGDSTHINVHGISYWFNLLKEVGFQSIHIKHIFSFGFPPTPILKAKIGIISIKPIFTPIKLLGQEILFYAVK